MNWAGGNAGLFCYERLKRTSLTLFRNIFPSRIVIQINNNNCVGSIHELTLRIKWLRAGFSGLLFLWYKN